MFAVLAAGANAAERGLLGINLFDSGVTVVTKFGNPDDIQAVNIGGMAGGGGTPGGGGPGGPARGGGAPRGGSGGGTGSSSDFSFGDFVFRQGGRPGGGGFGPPGADGGGPPGPMGSMGAGGSGGAPPAAGGGAAENATYTRWVYNRSGSKYGFIINKKGQVVQIEAIGMANSKVRTSKGVTFGNTFAQVIKKYKTPDGYDISGSNVMARYLTRNKVAFRFSRLGEGKPQVVTGIVVAAGK
ncbi:MAG: hypothetical protein ACAH95_10025 [Fimbriimonas sp.]